MWRKIQKGGMSMAVERIVKTVCVKFRKKGVEE